MKTLIAVCLLAASATVIAQSPAKDEKSAEKVQLKAGADEAKQETDGFVGHADVTSLPRSPKQEAGRRGSGEG